MFEVVQGSARVLNIKKTRKRRGDLQPDEFFRFQVDGSITRGELIPEFFGVLLIIDSIMPQQPRFQAISSVVQSAAT